jgi:uncharacterized protein
MQDLIGYDDIIETSMRSVIYETLKKIEKTGLPGKHYFMITFMTRFPGVLMPKFLLEKFSEEMTIALQHQYKSLAVERDSFKISLSFNGKYEKLSIPYKAVTSFADPAMNFALKFNMNYRDLEDLESATSDDSNQANKNSSAEKTASNVDLSAKVISIDAFRKDRNDNHNHNS